MKKINEHILRLTGGATLQGGLEADKTSNITKGEFDIFSVEYRDNQDGTFNKIYKGKFISELVIDQFGKTIRGIDKTKKSRKLRGAIYYLGGEEKVDDEDLFYGMVMDKLIANLSEVWEYIKSK